MRERNSYGLVGTARQTGVQRPTNGPRQAVTARGRMMLKRSRRQIGPR